MWASTVPELLSGQPRKEDTEPEYQLNSEWIEWQKTSLNQWTCDVVKLETNEHPIKVETRNLHGWPQRKRHQTMKDFWMKWLTPLIWFHENNNSPSNGPIICANKAKQPAEIPHTLKVRFSRLQKPNRFWLAAHATPRTDYSRQVINLFFQVK